MTDKEVGELWDLAKDAKPSQSDDLVTIRRMIHKLVEERAKATYINQWGEDPKYAEWNALRDFGIDPEIWEQNRED